jgi:hypothetical protein
LNVSAVCGRIFAMILAHKKKQNMIVIMFVLISIADVFGNSDTNSDKLKHALDSQYNALTQNERILIERVFVIVKDVKFGLTWSEARLSNVCISKKLIENPEIRYKISHYLHNQLVKESERVYFADYDDFVKENSALICSVIYYFYSKKYYGVYKIFPMESDNLFYDTRLGDDIIKLKDKLKLENSLFLYGQPINEVE